MCLPRAKGPEARSRFKATEEELNYLKVAQKVMAEKGRLKGRTVNQVGQREREKVGRDEAATDRKKKKGG